MDSSSSSEEDEESHLEYWNNWQPKINKSGLVKDQSRKEKQDKRFLHCNELVPVKGIKENLRPGNWIPPINFYKTKKDVVYRKSVHSDIQISQSSQKRRKILDSTLKNDLETKILTCSTKLNTSQSGITWKKVINLDWGERVQLHDTTTWNDGDVVWGMVKPGLFGLIKLWINEYGNICGLAEGTLSSIVSSEVTLISITKTELLRKMLYISKPQWTSLCEKVEQSKTFLKFEALGNSEVVEKTSLEKLWFFLCKRRHFFPEQCMLVKLSGAVKYLKEFKIIPKLVVQDIRSICGEPIS